MHMYIYIYYISIRLDLSICDQAHARARFSHRVEREDFEEAMRLMKASKDDAGAGDELGIGQKTSGILIFWGINIYEPAISGYGCQGFLLTSSNSSRFSLCLEDVMEFWRCLNSIRSTRANFVGQCNATPTTRCFFVFLSGRAWHPDVPGVESATVQEDVFNGCTRKSSGETSLLTVNLGGNVGYTMIYQIIRHTEIVLVPFSFFSTMISPWSTRFVPVTEVESIGCQSLGGIHWSTFSSTSWKLGDARKIGNPTVNL